MVRRRQRVPAQYRTVHALAFAPLFFQAAMAARNLGVLGAVAEARGLLPSEVAARTNLSFYAARVLLEGCLSLELVAFEDGRYQITEAGKLWLFDRMTRVNADFVQDVCYRGAFHMEESVRDGTPAGLQVFGAWPTIYEGLSQLPPDVQRSWFAFDHYYSDGVFPEAFTHVFAAKPARLLDVGGNTGKWALHCLTHDPEVRITALDHPGQLARLRENVEAAGVADRLETVPIDLLDRAHAFPTGFDAVWMSQVLDCFGEDDVLAILERGKAALAPGGKLYVLEAFWDRQSNDVAQLCLHGTSLYFTCMANGTSRMYHSDDLLDLIPRAGLTVVEDRPLGHSHTLLTCAVA